MSEVILTKVTAGHDGPLPPCLTVRDRVHQVQSRACEIFQARGGGPDHELDDWLQAESEMIWNARVVFRENAGGFEVDFLVPGFAPEHIELAITPL